MKYSCSKAIQSHVHEQNKYLSQLCNKSTSFRIPTKQATSVLICTAQNHHYISPPLKDLHSNEMYSTWFGDDVVRFSPLLQGGQIGVARLYQGEPSHETWLKSALGLRSMNAKSSKFSVVEHAQLRIQPNTIFFNDNLC